MAESTPTAEKGGTSGAPRCCIRCGRCEDAAEQTMALTTEGWVCLEHLNGADAPPQVCAGQPCRQGVACKNPWCLYRDATSNGDGVVEVCACTAACIWAYETRGVLWQAADADLIPCPRRNRRYRPAKIP